VKKTKKVDPKFEWTRLWKVQGFCISCCYAYLFSLWYDIERWNSK